MCTVVGSVVIWKDYLGGKTANVKKSGLKGKVFIITGANTGEVAASVKLRRTTLAVSSLQASGGRWRGTSLGSTLRSTWPAET